MAYTTSLYAPEYFEYGLYIPDPIYRRDSSLSTQFSGPHSSTSNVNHDDSESSDHNAKKNAPPPPDKLTQMFNGLGAVGGMITVDNAIMSAQSQGYALTKGDMEEIRRNYPNGVSVEDFKGIFNVYGMKYNDKAEVMMELFSYFDSAHTGTMTRAQVVNVLSVYGECLTGPEVESALTDLGYTGNTIEYKSFITKLLESNMSLRM